MHSSRSICRGSSGCCSSPRWSRSSRLCWCSCARFFSRCRARATRCAREAADSSRRDRGLSPVRSGHDQILVEPAFQWPVIERRAPGRGQPDQLRKPRIPREEVAAPARVVLLQRIAEPRVELRERRLLARLREEAALAEVSPRLGGTLEKYYAGLRCYLLSGGTRLPELIRLTASRRTPLYNGPLECRLYEYLIVAGSNRRKSAIPAG